MSVSVSPSIFVCLLVGLAATLPWSLYLLSNFTVIVSFDFVIQPNSHQSSPIIFWFIFSSVHWGRIQDIEFEWHGLPLPVRCMGNPFQVSIKYYFVLFVLQRVTFCFSLFFELSLATITGVDACLHLPFDIF